MKLLSAIAGFVLALISVVPASAAVFILQSPVAQTSAVPVLSNIGGSVDYVGSGPSVVVDSGQDIGITCPCTTLTSATVTISAGQFTGDVLQAAPLAGLTATFSSPTLTISGTAALGAYVSVLNSVTYSSSNADPTNSGSNLTRTITWNVVNGSTGSSSPTSTINVSSGVPAPTLTASGSVSTFTSGGSAVALDGGITLTCSCTTLSSATIDIGTGLLGGDTLNTVTPGSLTQAYDVASGTLTLTGTATLAVYQTAFRSITYSSSLTDPTNNGANPTRQITWTAINGPASGTLQGVVNVQNPSVPTIALATNNTVIYTGGGSPAVLNGALTVTCTCTNLTSATLTLSSGFFTGDALNLASSLGITAVYNSGTGVLNMTGTTTVANYQTLMRTITYSSSSGDPSNGGLNAIRRATWVAFNGANGSPPISTIISVFIAGQPSWVMTGAQVALNPATSQAWVNGLGTGPIGAELTVTRATTETCYGGVAPNYVTYAAPNTACTTPTGMAVWPSYTNYMLNSLDWSNAGSWIIYCGGGSAPSFNCGGANPNNVIVTGNSVLDPTGVTSHAAKVAVSRTATGTYAEVATGQINAPSGLYSAGFWLQADTPGDVGKIIQFGFLSSAGYNVHNIALPTAWTWFPYYNLANITAGCTGNTQSCQFVVGLTNQPGSGPASTTLSATFDVWGAELNGGNYVFPVVATGVTPIAVQADNIAVQSGSAMETALSGVASSTIMNSTLGIQNTASTLVDSNGVTLLGEASNNVLTSSLPIALNTSNVGIWSGPVIEGYSRDGSGRSLALNKLIVAKDSLQTVIGKPLYLGSTLGTQNFFSGYLGTMNVFNTRVADSLLGVTGVGTDYYFANNVTCTAIVAGTSGSCNDSNPCTITLACNSISKAQSLSIVTNDTMRFNGGDTFTGCLTETGGVNWNATRGSPSTIESFGAGQATLTPNCTATQSQIGIINLKSTDGVVINNLRLVGDSAGNAARGIELENCDFSSPHGNITIQNNNFTGIHDGPSNNFGGAIFGDASCNNGSKMIDHVSVLNNTDAGASPTASDNSFIESYGYACSLQFDVVQGNLIYNLGGNNLAFSGGEGTGILFNGVCGAGSSNAGSHGAPSGTSGGIAQFNVIHDNDANINACGASYASWSAEADNTTHRMSEVYNIQGIGGCDHGAFDLDAGGGQQDQNNLVERNYSHGNFGPCLAFYFGSNNTARWNICDGDGVGSGPTHELGPLSVFGTPLMYAYNNVVVGPPGNSGAVVEINGCPPTGSLLANNIFVGRYSGGQQNMLIMGVQNTGAQCSPAPVGNLQITHNDWWSTHSGVNPTNWQIWASTNNGSFSSPNGSNTTYAAMAAITHETGGFSVDPLFVTPYGQATCGNTTGGPQANSPACPAGMRLQGGSSMHAPAGAVLTSQPFNLPANNGGGVNNPTHGQGTLDYWGTVLPCPTVGGFPIGAEC